MLSAASTAMARNTRQSLDASEDHAHSPTSAITPSESVAEQAIHDHRGQRLAAFEDVVAQAVGARRVGADAGRQEAADEGADEEDVAPPSRS